MSEHIGNVCIEDSFYKEEFEYQIAEDSHLCDLVSDHTENEYNQLIAREKNWAILLPLSHIRANLVEWLPVRKTDSILVVGAGCGELTRVLADKGLSVTCTERSMRACQIHASRVRELDNVQILAGRYCDVEPLLQQKFDWIFLTGSFEKAKDETDDRHPQEALLNRVKKHLSDRGSIVLTSANRLGLRYFAGEKDEMTGSYFKGIEGYEEDSRGKTFSRPELERICSECGFADPLFYYPYPDACLPMSIYSDEYLPKVGELWDNIRNFKDERYVLFNETKAFDRIIEDNLFPVFSNAFLVILNGKDVQTVFCKYSNERAEKFAIRTDILQDENKHRAARKTACSPTGRTHVKRLPEWMEKLDDVYQNTRIRMNRCEDTEEGTLIEYLEGQTLEEMLDRLTHEGKHEEALSLLLEYLREVEKAGSSRQFVSTPEFEEVFGNVILPEGLLCSDVTDIDMVLGNVILRDQEWIHMDYEWTFDFPVPVHYVIYRIIQNYLYGNVRRTEMQKEWLYKKAGLTELEIAMYTEMEQHFQSYITGTHMPLRLLYDEVSPGCISFAAEEEQRKEKAAASAAANTGIEIFVDRFEIAMAGIYVSGWAVSKNDRKVRFRLLDQDGKELEIRNTEYLYRKDVADQFRLSQKNSYAGFLLHCSLPDAQATQGKSFTLIGYDGITEVPFVIPVGKLRLKQSRIGRKLMDLRGAKDVIEYIAPKDMGLIGESGQYRIENQRFDTWQMANRLSEKELQRQRQTHFASEPLISVLILKTEDGKAIRRTTDSIKKQTYSRTEVICDETDHVSLERISGDYVCIMNAGDILKANALYEFVSYLDRHAETDLVYSDSDSVDWERKMYFDPQFKPDFACYTLQSGNYIGNSVLFRKSLLSRVGDLKNLDQPQSVYALLLKCADLTDQTGHISQILYHTANPYERSREERKQLSDAWEAGRKILEDYYREKKIPTEVSWAKHPLSYDVRWKIEKQPLVSVIIPNQDHIEDLEKCLSSIERKTSYQNLEVLVVENNSKQKSTFEYYRQMQERYSKVRLLTWDAEFNYSAINNFAVREAKGEYFLFLNNDTEVLSNDWLERLTADCMQKKVGIVGCRLYYPDDTLQHVGVILGLGGIAGHLFVKEPGTIPGYMGRACLKQNLSAVTAACMICSREAFEKTGGFDEKLKVALNDVDFCMRVIQAGYMVLYEPEAELYHYESKSRGLDLSPEKKARYDSEVAYFKERWGSVLKEGDPFYNVNLSRTTWNCSFRIPRK